MNDTFLNDVLSMLDKNDNENVCLISQSELEKDYVTLECGHKFNYNSIYEELKNQKSYKNKYEIQNLKSYQLKCPYCRNIQNKILPFYKDKLEQYPKIYGVNSPSKYCMYTNKCNYIFKSGKRKGMTCSVPCNDNMCNKHKNIIVKDRCTAILKSGKRKNQRCLNYAKQDKLCLIHQNKKRP